jgi:ornithine--oxo-acid transaminase
MPTIDAASPVTGYRRGVNPQWVRLLDVLGMNVQYTHCAGAELQTADGQRVLDFLSGYCVHNAGHNHPKIVAAVAEELGRGGAMILQSHAGDLAGALAERLCRLAGGRLGRAFFCSSGSEGIETAIKFARAHTGRPGLLSAAGAFHGLTSGALALMDHELWTRGFGPFLPETARVPFNDPRALEAALATQRFAAFIVEPIQAEAGIRLPDPHYLVTAQALCRRHGTLLVLDEVQTGFYRTGPFLAAHYFGVEPDMVVLAKALSGGLIPSAAVLMSEAISDSVYDSLKRAVVHTSTYSENRLAMRAGLATLDVLEDSRLGERAAAMGEALRRRLREALAGHEMVGAVRGLGLLCGVEFAPPRQLRLKLPFEMFSAIHPAFFGKMVVRRLFREHGVLTELCGNDFRVLKAAPPLVVEERHLEAFVSALRAVVEAMHGAGDFWSEALALARRVVDV